MTPREARTHARPRTAPPVPGTRSAAARRTGAAVAAAVLLTSPLATAGAVAATGTDDDGDVTVVNTETVQAKLDATGRVREARLYEQLSFTGSGTATVVNPTSTQGLRNLDAFGGFSVEDGAMRATVDVDGDHRLRTVSDHEGDLPVTVDVEYLLDGEPVTPGAVVGRDGELEVRYTVTNRTVRQDEVTYDDGTGATATATAETVIPMVGQLTTVLPPSFTGVSSGEASIAGDGRGGTRLSFTMTLFPPIGSPSAEFGYTATVRDGMIPAANVSVLPVRPLESPSFKGGAASYASGADSGIALTAGATEIDANLLRLHDGAATLLAGLQQLEEGARTLSAGLQGEAVPGSEQLADGAAELHEGARTLDAGVRRLDAGTAQLADGVVRASAGATALSSGAARLDTGLRTAGQKAPALVDGLRQVQAGLDTLDAGLAQLHDGIGGVPAQAAPLGKGVDELRAGITQLQAGAVSLRTTAGQLGALLTALGDTNPTVVVAEPGNAQRLAQLGAFVQGVAQTRTGAERAQLEAVAALYTSPPAPVVPLGPGLKVLGGVLTDGVVPGVWRLQCGLGGLDAATTAAACGGATGLDGGLLKVDAGLDQLVAAVVASVQGAVGTEGQTKEDGTLRGGTASLEAGTARILTGAQDLLAGLGQLSTGASELSAGAGTLAQGAGALQSGATTLRAGTGELAAGTGRLTDGTDRLAAGSAELAAGLADAGDGSELLADGLTEAAAGAPALVDGARRLSEEGTSLLVERGATTAADYGVKYAVIEAGTERAVTEGMAYGAPDGAAAMTAYSLDIAAVDGSNANAVGRGLAAAALFALGAVALPLRRRFL